MFNSHGRRAKIDQTSSNKRAKTAHRSWFRSPAREISFGAEVQMMHALAVTLFLGRQFDAREAAQFLISGEAFTSS